MNLPPTHGSLAHAALPDDGQRERSTLARKWAYLLSQTSYVPWSHTELEQRLLVFVTELVDLVRSEPFTADPAGAIGVQLVEWRCTDPASLRRCVTVLSKGLLGLAELRSVADRADRVVAVVVSLAAGFTEQMREFVIGQQESMSKALRRAVFNAEESLRASEAWFNQVTTTSPSGIAITDLDGNFIRTNDALRRILAYPGEDLDRRCLYDVVPPQRTEQLLALYANLGAGQENPPRQMLRLRRDDDSIATVAIAASPLRDADGTPNRVVLVIEDISELTLLQDELCRQALHDMLTGLPNRQYFTSRLEEVVHRAGNTGDITLYLLGLDAFTLITAGLGRRVSERLLVHVDRATEVHCGRRAGDGGPVRRRRVRHPGGELADHAGTGPDRRADQRGTGRAGGRRERESCGVREHRHRGGAAGQPRLDRTARRRRDDVAQGTAQPRPSVRAVRPGRGRSRPRDLPARRRHGGRLGTRRPARRLPTLRPTAARGSGRRRAAAALASARARPAGPRPLRQPGRTDRFDPAAGHLATLLGLRDRP